MSAPGSLDSLPPWRWTGRRKRVRDDGSAAAFGARLFASVALTLTLVGVAGYLVIDNRLQDRLVAGYADAQRADAQSFEAAAARATSPRRALREVDEVLSTIAGRPGTIDARLIDRRHVIRLAGSEADVGTTYSDPAIDATLERGTSYGAREAAHNGEESRNFEFVTPVDLDGVRYAYEVVYAHGTFEAQLDGVRLTLVLVGAIGLLLGGVVFYLVGGRSLVRSHRFALQRATRDGLTDLPNQRAFQDELPQAVAAATRYQEPLALAVLDVDNFKFINDRHGHPHGDELLKRVAHVLKAQRSADRAYRTGGDEFALLLPHADVEAAHTLARRLQRTLSDVGVEVSLGVSTLRPGRAADAIRAEADAALYEAKRQGGNQIAHYEDIRESVTVTSARNREIVHRLIEEGRLTTVFQPIWDLSLDIMLGVEALTRPDPSYQLAGITEAFDIADQLGRVHALDVLCVESALQAARDLPADMLLFLNVSPQTLDVDADRNDWLREAVEAVGLPLERIVVEVTERFGARTSAVVTCLQRLRADGFKIAMDDVGTGNSGLEMLSQIGADFVKLDQSIVARSPTDPNARAVLMAMATFARQTGAFVIAEGIEDDDTLEFLRGIDHRDFGPDTIIQGGQGYGLGHPTPTLPAGAHPLAHL